MTTAPPFSTSRARAPESIALPAVPVLAPLRRQAGLVMLTIAAALVAVGTFLDGIALLSLNERVALVGGGMVAAGYLLAAMTAFVGMGWTDRLSPRGDRRVLALFGVALGLLAIEEAAQTISGSYSWPVWVHTMLAFGDLAGYGLIGVLLLMLTTWYRSRQVAGSSHDSVTPFVPLLLAAIGFCGYALTFIFQTQWVSYTPTIERMDGVLSFVALSMVAGAVLIAGLVHLGPLVRLVVAASGVAVFGLAVLLADLYAATLHLHLIGASTIIGSVGLGAIAGVLLASAIIVAQPRPTSRVVTAFPGQGAPGPPAQSIPVLVTPTSPVTTTPTAPPVNFCRHCGTKREPPDASFCTGCGARF